MVQKPSGTHYKLNKLGRIAPRVPLTKTASFVHPETDETIFYEEEVSKAPMQGRAELKIDFPRSVNKRQWRTWVRDQRIAAVLTIMSQYSVGLEALGERLGVHKATLQRVAKRSGLVVRQIGHAWCGPSNFADAEQARDLLNHSFRSNTVSTKSFYGHPALFFQTGNYYTSPKIHVLTKNGKSQEATKPTATPSASEKLGKGDLAQPAQSDESKPVLVDSKPFNKRALNRTKYMIKWLDQAMKASKGPDDWKCFASFEEPQLCTVQNSYDEKGKICAQRLAVVPKTLAQNITLSDLSTRSFFLKEG